MTKKIFIPALFFSQSVFAADFTGHWVATDGQVQSTIGISGPCSVVDVVIEQTNVALVTKSYKANCQNFSSDWGPVTEEIRDGRVFEGEREVGTFDGTSLKTTSQDSSVNYTYNLHFVTEADGQPVLESSYGTKNFAGQILIVARLRRASSSTP